MKKITFLAISIFFLACSSKNLNLVDTEGIERGIFGIFLGSNVKNYNAEYFTANIYKIKPPEPDGFFTSYEVTVDKNEKINKITGDKIYNNGNCLNNYNKLLKKLTEEYGEPEISEHAAGDRAIRYSRESNAFYTYMKQSGTSRNASFYSGNTLIMLSSFCNRGGGYQTMNLSIMSR